ncbi:hypothetical protein AB0A71_35130 [Kitasatospora aureofaciens]|uniref:hypothetical protein n=1 Tax=Kitasatospora aureofaciens TaxID=1894 RepID=UPI003401EFB8
MRAKIRIVSECTGCAQPLTYDRSKLYAGWQHAAEPAPESEEGRCTEPAPQRFCELCGRPATNWQDAWADYSGCRPCGNYDRYSLGD